MSINIPLSEEEARIMIADTDILLKKPKLGMMELKRIGDNATKILEYNQGAKIKEVSDKVRDYFRFLTEKTQRTEANKELQKPMEKRAESLPIPRPKVAPMPLPNAEDDADEDDGDSSNNGRTKITAKAGIIDGEYLFALLPKKSELPEPRAAAFKAACGVLATAIIDDAKSLEKAVSDMTRSALRAGVDLRTIKLVFQTFGIQKGIRQSLQQKIPGIIDEIADEKTYDPDLDEDDADDDPSDDVLKQIERTMQRKKKR